MNDKFFDLKREKQDRMINASLKVFAENGYRHASTDEIVKDAGISKGLLFHYFTSKMGLYEFLFDYSVKYMLFEFSRIIGEQEKDYFKLREQIENAKLNVLRNYPFMNEFIERGLLENQIDVIETTEKSMNAYIERMNVYYNQTNPPKLKKGINRTSLDKLIVFTVRGLTREQIDNDSYQPEMLYQQICEYLEMIKKMSTE